jgi:predicted HNH restriction endonuclease
MDKLAAKYVQQKMQNIGEPKSSSKLKKQLKAEARTAKQIPRAALKSLRTKCPICKEQLPQVSMAIRRHFFEVHHQELTEAESYRIVSGPGSKKIPYSEGIIKDPREVSGGLPSLGKRR